MTILPFRKTKALFIGLPILNKTPEKFYLFIANLCSDNLPKFIRKSIFIWKYSNCIYKQYLLFMHTQLEIFLASNLQDRLLKSCTVESPKTRAFPVLKSKTVDFGLDFLITKAGTRRGLYEEFAILEARSIRSILETFNLINPQILLIVIFEISF